MAPSTQRLSSRSGEPQVILGYVTSLTPAWDHLKSPTVQQQYRFETCILVVFAQLQSFVLCPAPLHGVPPESPGPSHPRWPSLRLQPVFAEGRKAKKENKGTEGGGGGRGGRAHCPSHTGSPLWAGHRFLSWCLGKLLNFSSPCSACRRPGATIAQKLPLTSKDVRLGEGESKGFGTCLG